MDALRRSDEAGLVHTSNNSQDRANVICNCCPCCCTVLRGRTELNHPHAFEPSRFEAKVDDAACTGCGVCAEERCPVKAIEMKTTSRGGRRAVHRVRTLRDRLSRAGDRAC